MKPEAFPILPIKRDLTLAYRLSLAVAALMAAASAAGIALGLLGRLYGPDPALALLTFGQDATGALLTALADGAPVDPAPRHVWISDLALGAPAPLDVPTVVALLVFGAVSFAPLAFFRGVEGARAGRAEVHGSAASLSGGKARGGTPWKRATSGEAAGRWSGPTPKPRIPGGRDSTS